ncbi:MAG: gamma-glutamylcyclotransferase family protein [Acidimicrobiia bacterium]
MTRWPACGFLMRAWCPGREFPATACDDARRDRPPRAARADGGRRELGLARREEVDPGLVLALGDPDGRLVAYGTLRPGEANEHVLTDAIGTWTAATVRGVVGDWRGYPILRPDPLAPAVDVMVLVSEDLPRLWPRLDVRGPAIPQVDRLERRRRAAQARCTSRA